MWKPKLSVLLRRVFNAEEFVHFPAVLRLLPNMFFSKPIKRRHCCMANSKDFVSHVNYTETNTNPNPTINSKLNLSFALVAHPLPQTDPPMIFLKRD